MATSCEDVIEVELEDGPLQLVVNGGITTENPAKVILSTTAPYFEEGPTPRVTGASVRIFENGQLFEALTEDVSKPGNYIGTKTGEIGKSYAIEIEIGDDGSHFQQTFWRSKNEIIFPIFEIDSIYTTFIRTPPLPIGNYLNFQFLRPFSYPQGAFYRIQRAINDSAFLQDFLFIELAADLESFRFRPVFNGLVEPGDTIDLTFSSITPSYREYLQVLFQQLNPGFLFDPPPAPIRGNVQEENDKRVALGYFWASSIIKGRYIDPEED
ncbi:MAG: DUF4249 domain-containing protein [Cryomorphaceae bacterium]|nr:DUF4249 domain-containing protein [Cryomorphaceae bacterium]